MSGKSNKFIVWHIVGCMLFLALPVFLFPHPPEERDFLFSRPTQRDFLGNIIMLGFFYINYFLLIPRLYFKRAYTFYVLCVLVGFLIITLVPSFITGHNPFIAYTPPAQASGFHQIPGWKPDGFTFIEEIRHHIFLYAAIILFSILLRIRDRLLQTEQARYTVELTSLKDQINPHFLFNTLNGIYALAVRDKSSATASSILKLSGLMRYVVTETGVGLVSLEKEIAYINDYIELQKMRLDKRIQLLYAVKGSIEDQQIAPLTLIPFIENAFKHGVNPDDDSNINIQIEIAKAQLTLVVENNKVKVALESHEKSGRGIENTKARLQLLYPSKHFLLLSQDDNHFRVQLTIQLV